MKVSNEKFDKLLAGSDVVKAKKDGVAGIILAVRESPKGFGAPLIIDFDTDVLPGIHSWPCNITEARKLAGMIDTDTENWVGAAIGLELIKVNNPQTSRMVDSLAVGFFIPREEAAKTRKTTPKYKLSQIARNGGLSKKAFTKADVPF